MEQIDYRYQGPHGQFQQPAVSDHLINELIGELSNHRDKASFDRAISKFDNDFVEKFKARNPAPVGQFPFGGAASPFAQQAQWPQQGYQQMPQQYQGYGPPARSGSRGGYTPEPGYDPMASQYQSYRPRSGSREAQPYREPPVFKEDIYQRRTPDIYRMSPHDNQYIAPVPPMPSGRAPQRFEMTEDPYKTSYSMSPYKAQQYPGPQMEQYAPMPSQPLAPQYPARQQTPPRSHTPPRAMAPPMNEPRPPRDPLAESADMRRAKEEMLRSRR